MTEVSLELTSVILQNTVYLICLGWLAWSWERRRGGDAFHLIVAYVGGTLLLSLLMDRLALHAFIAVLMAGGVAYTIAEFWPSLSRPVNSNYWLVQVIVLASITLVGFDWVTSHTPLSFKVPNIGLIDVVLLCAFPTWIWILHNNKSRLGMMLRLGTHNRWAVEYWCRPLPRPSRLLGVSQFLCWLPILAIPMATTGLLSSTILKDVSIAILIARVASSRGPVILFTISATLAALRTGVGFIFVSNLGPPLVEAMVFLALLLWLQYRGSRTAWKEI